MNTTDRTSGTSDHQPIQSRLQIEAASSGRTAKRVQTLQGLAWRIQVSPRSPNSLATRRSPVEPVVPDVAGVVISGLPAAAVRLPRWPPGS